MKLNEHLARQQFYRQNGLPIELNSIIEGIIRDEQLKKNAFYQKVYDNLKDIDRQHENFAFSHQMLNLLEQEKEKYLNDLKEKEIQEILDREIKE